VKSDTVLYVSRDKNIRQSDIEKALSDAGLGKGDLVMVHSDISAFGKLGEARGKEQLLGSLLSAFLNVIDGGTLVVPTYTYSFCKDEVFDVKNTKSTVGNFTEFVRMQPSAIRSIDPIFSHAAIGKDAKKLLQGVSASCFGEDSFFDRFYHADGKIMNFGKFFDITFIHYIERKYGVDYRYDKQFSGEIIKEDGAHLNRDVTFYVRALPEEGKTVVYEMPKLGDELERRGLLKRVALGDSFILLSKARDCFEVGIEMLKADPYVFLRSDPNRPMQQGK
jgi:aminoglycoside 3-N-acetyltransferase